MTPQTLRCVEAYQSGGETSMALATRPMPQIPAGEVLIRVHYSSLNYKDALAATGQHGVVPNYPQVPGIDAAGVVEESRDARFQPGDEVIATSHDLGTSRPGGWAEYLVAPADWVVPLPAGLTLREAMILGTAGLTVAQCVHALQLHEIAPARGELLVTGASGGVGSLALRLLAQLGYVVVAVSGKPAQHAMLRTFGAKEILPREAAVDSSQKPLLRARWAGVVDTVGGATLVTAIRQTLPFGCVTACGLVGGAELALTVHPFILRGVSLCGVSSATCPYELRYALWNKLAHDWKPRLLETLVEEVRPAALLELVPKMLRAGVAGRVIVNLL